MIRKPKWNNSPIVTQWVNRELSLMSGRYFVYLVLFCFKSGKSLPMGSGDKTKSHLWATVSGFHSGSCKSPWIIFFLTVENQKLCNYHYFVTPWHWVIEELVLSAARLSLLGQRRGRWRSMMGLIILVQDMKRSPEAFWARILSYYMWWDADRVLVSPSSKGLRKRSFKVLGTFPVTAPHDKAHQAYTGLP